MADYVAQLKRKERWFEFAFRANLILAFVIAILADHGPLWFTRLGVLIPLGLLAWMVCLLVFAVRSTVKSRVLAEQQLAWRSGLVGR